MVPWPTGGSYPSPCPTKPGEPLSRPFCAPWGRFGGIRGRRIHRNATNSFPGGVGVPPVSGFRPRNSTSSWVERIAAPKQGEASLSTAERLTVAFLVLPGEGRPPSEGSFPLRSTQGFPSMIPERLHRHWRCRTERPWCIDPPPAHDSRIGTGAAPRVYFYCMRR